MTRIQLWNGDICELEVDAIVSPANPSLWMSTGVAEALKAKAGEEVEFAAVRQLPVSVGDAVVTAAGRLAARLVIHAVSLDRDRRTNAAIVEAAIRSAFARAREHEVTTLAMPGLGSPVGGFPSRPPPRSPWPRSATSSGAHRRSSPSWSRSAGSPSTRPSSEP